jgi:hypothetical protein
MVIEGTRTASGAGAASATVVVGSGLAALAMIGRKRVRR